MCVVQEGKGQKEKGAIDLKAVHEVRVSEAPGSDEFFEFEIVANDRTFRCGPLLLPSRPSPPSSHRLPRSSPLLYTLPPLSPSSSHPSWS